MLSKPSQVTTPSYKGDCPGELPASIVGDEKGRLPIGFGRASPQYTPPKALASVQKTQDMGSTYGRRRG